jgi:tRNA dimethylallyltransferase
VRVLTRSEGVLVLAGPTASGKTDLAIALAQRFDAEIVGADSRQIYSGMPIGTAAPNDAQLAAVPHHLIGFLDPRERYSAGRYARDAQETIRDIHERGRRAIVSGGTGFYVRALTGDVRLALQFDEALRERLAHEAMMHPPEFLHDWLRVHDPSRAQALDPNDTYRVLRALEIALATESAADSVAPRSNDDNLQFFKVFLDVPLSENDRRIDARTDAMLQAGLVEEAERIGADAVAATAVGYPQALAHARGWSTHAELREALARATRRYARRQRGWFRREPETHWLPPEAVEHAAREKLGWS